MVSLQSAFFRFFGLIILICSISLIAMEQIAIPYSSEIFVVKYLPWEAAMAVVSLVFWLIFLRERAPLRFNETQPKAKNIFFFAMFFLISLSTVIILSSDHFELSRFLVLVGVAIAVGVNEEFCFRVAGFSQLQKSGMGQRRAILISSLCFSLFHLTNLYAGVGLEIVFQLINAFLMGIVFSLLILKTGSIVYSIVAHGLWDLTSFLNSSFGTGDIKLYVAFIMMVISIPFYIWAVKTLVKMSTPSST
jgi:membrane protease YdiL (CAAX protease family)